MPMWTMTFLQNSNSPMMEFLIFFHDTSMILVMILIVNLSLIMFMITKMEFFCLMFPESQSLEDLWLTIPIIFLLFIGFPSIKNLYMYEEFNECDLSFKVVGHQWYWSYSFINSSFDSIMNKENFYFRLLETFNHLILPVKSMIRLMVSSEDVIHSWAVPSLGVKMDATPGKISQSIIMINRTGLIMGQCSEICGANHSFMPITISANSMKNFLNG